MAEPKKPKIKFTVAGMGNPDGLYYRVIDLLAIMEMRSGRLHLITLFHNGEPPFPIPTRIQDALAHGEEITPKQYKKLIRWYQREWNIYVSRTVEEQPEFVPRELWWRRN